MNKFLIPITFSLSVSVANAQDTATAFEQQIPGSDVKFKMVPIPAGSFKWGARAGDNSAEADEKPAKTVKLDAFWMSAYEVTYDEFNLFFVDTEISQNIPTDGLTRPSSPYIDMTLGMGKAGGFPANSMQQYGALMYCRWLYQKTGIFYRLPTEAEWEYAARAGSETIYPFGNDAKSLGDYAWHAANSGDKYQKVGQKKPNAWGLYDMLGNVAEWVLDQYQEDFLQSISENTANPIRQPETRHPRTVKGGSFRDPATALRPSDRVKSDLVWNRRDPQIPKSRWWNADAPFIGFRLVRPAVQPGADEIKLFFETHLGF
ncbi:MAG: formylglycine-generating enzyme family protein [Chitinophagaceae bacterium]|nr:formylglycine-generating enzyme family protein [Chitinophagaceae bacterium]